LSVRWLVVSALCHPALACPSAFTLQWILGEIAAGEFRVIRTEFAVGTLADIQRTVRSLSCLSLWNLKNCICLWNDSGPLPVFRVVLLPRNLRMSWRVTFVERCYEHTSFL